MQPPGNNCSSLTVKKWCAIFQHGDFEIQDTAWETIIGVNSWNCWSCLWLFWLVDESWPEEMLKHWRYPWTSWVCRNCRPSADSKLYRLDTSKLIIQHCQRFGNRFYNVYLLLTEYSYTIMKRGSFSWRNLNPKSHQEWSCPGFCFSFIKYKLSSKDGT